MHALSRNHLLAESQSRWIIGICVEALKAKNKRQEPRHRNQAILLTMEKSKQPGIPCVPRAQPDAPTNSSKFPEDERHMSRERKAHIRSQRKRKSSPQSNGCATAARRLVLKGGCHPSKYAEAKSKCRDKHIGAVKEKNE